MAKRTTLFYLIIGMFWIIVSDLAVESLIPNLSELVSFGIIKGLFFVSVTAALLFLFIKRFEDQREHNERNYQRLFIQNPNAMLLTRRSDGRIFAANEAACQLYGFTADELKKMYHHELEVPGRALGVMHQLKQHRNNHDKIIWVKEFVSELEVPGTGLSNLHLIVSAHEAAEAEAARVATQERLERLLQGMPDMVLGIGRDGKINFYNPALLQHLHATEAEVLGEPAMEVLRKKNGDWWEAVMTNAWAQQRFITERYYAPSRQWLRISSYQSPDGLGILISDITQQHLLEDTLNQFQLTLEAVVNASDDQIWAVDQHGKLLAANKSFYEAAEKRGVHYGTNQSLFELEKEAVWFEDWKRAYATAMNGEKVEWMVNDSLNDLPYPTLDLKMYPIKNAEGKVVCVGCFAHNAARRLAHEHQLHLQQQKLLDIAWQQSHEMRAPLANILGISQLISQDAEMQRGEVLQYLAELNKAAARLDDIIRLVVSQSSNVTPTAPDGKLH